MGALPLDPMGNVRPPDPTENLDPTSHKNRATPHCSNLDTPAKRARRPDYSAVVALGLRDVTDCKAVNLNSA